MQRNETKYHFRRPYMTNDMSDGLEACDDCEEILNKQLWKTFS